MLVIVMDDNDDVDDEDDNANGDDFRLTVVLS